MTRLLARLVVDRCRGRQPSDLVRHVDRVLLAVIGLARPTNRFVIRATQPPPIFALVVLPNLEVLASQLHHPLSLRHPNSLCLVVQGVG